MAGAGPTRELILDAARAALLADGFVGLSTRKVAAGAGVPLSQLHYHFGGKQQLILSVLERDNERLLARQARMYGEERPLWERYQQACEFLDEDLDSGYVRILQEMAAAGWANEQVAAAVRTVLSGWVVLLTDVAQAAESAGLSLGPFSPAEVGTLLGLMFMGGESLLLLGLESEQVPVRSALRRVGDLIRMAETGR